MSQNVTITELWQSKIEWAPGSTQEAGVLLSGNPNKVKGNCGDCGHEWTLRGISQVQDKWWGEATA